MKIKYILLVVLCGYAISAFGLDFKTEGCPQGAINDIGVEFYDLGGIGGHVIEKPNTTTSVRVPDRAKSVHVSASLTGDILTDYPNMELVDKHNGFVYSSLKPHKTWNKFESIPQSVTLMCKK